VRTAVRPIKKFGHQSTAEKNGDARTDAGRLFQADAAAAGKARWPTVAQCRW